MSGTEPTPAAHPAVDAPRHPRLADDDVVIVAPWSCPSWCRVPPGHYFEADRVNLDSTRTHELEVGGVTICQRETIVDAGAGGIVLEQPFIWMWGAEELTAEDGRRLGRALLAAADRLDAIAGDARRAAEEGL